MPPDDRPLVELIERRRVTADGPGLERVRLRHRRHDGTLSDVLERHVTAAGRRAVSVLAWDPVDDRVVLVEQFRTGAWLAAHDERSPADVPAWMLEVIAGSLEPGEDPAETARRELVEEAGCVAGDLVRVACWCPDPEQSAAAMTLYATCTRAPAGDSLRGNAHEQEDLRVRLLSPAEIEIALADGRVGNATTLIALHWFLRAGRRVLGG